MSRASLAAPGASSSVKQEQSPESQTTRLRQAAKIFQDKLSQLEPLHAAARPDDIEGLYNVDAWYLVFGYPPVFPHENAVPGDAVIFTRSRHIVALTELAQLWTVEDSIPQVRKSLRKETPLPTWPSIDFVEALLEIARRNISFAVSSALTADIGFHTSGVLAAILLSAWDVQSTTKVLRVTGNAVADADVGDFIVVCHYEGD
ncbi:hypothetical protein OPT61_g680 [Boeremia exigua]|uniref:Uncharacterized protein n=1 Tax=Boeremia exigua TaxID=749465 RepID=A0ACC2ITA7_9PLEO|nr:hypothetical protein OPT61_g680 [Boeremia exigua]